MPAIVVNRRRLVTVLTVVTCLLCLAGLVVGLASRWLGIENFPCDTMLSLRGEGNVPTYWSTVLLFTAGAALFLVAQAEAPSDARQARCWRAAGYILLYLSADEAAQLHEACGRAMRAFVPDTPLLYWPWVILGGAAVIVVGLAFVRFLRALPGDTRRNLIIAGALFVTGALGLELVGAAIEWGHRSEAYLVVEEMLEEGLEMLGVVYLIHALLCHLGRHLPPVSLRVEPDERAE